MTKPVVVPKQLKKQDFLDAVTEAPMTKAALVESLDGFTFIPAYLDYLTEHFVANGRVIRNADGTIQRKGKKKVTVREIHRVVFDAEATAKAGNEVFKLETLPFDAEAIKGDEFAMTPSAAVKKYKSKLFKQYNGRLAAVNALAPKAEKDEQAE